MVEVAFPLLALSFTRNTLLISGVVVAGRLPALLVGLPVGALADRVNRRQMLIRIEILRFITLAGFAALVLAGADDLPVLYVTVFLLGSLTFGFEVAAFTALPELVDSTQLVIANSHLQAVELTADEMVGQAAGGFAFAAARYVPFLCDAASFALSAGFVATAVPDNAPTGGETTLWADLKDGLKWFARDPLMRLLTAVIASLAFCQAAVIGLLVLYGTQDLHLSKSGYGLLLGVSSVGGLTGAIGAGRIQARLGSGATLNLVGVVAALSYLALAETNVPFLAAGILAVEAMAVTVGIVTGRALRQGTVPQEMMGRVGSAARTVLFGVVPLGGLVGGLAAEHVGVRHTILMAGVLQMDALLLLAPRLIQRLREQRPA